MWDFLVRIQVFVHIHGEIHHVCVAEEVQLSLKKFLFIVDLSQLKAKVFNVIWVTHSNNCTKQKKRNDIWSGLTVMNAARSVQPVVANVNPVRSL